MDHLAFAIVAAFVLAFSLISRRLERTMITPPMVFTAFGVILGGGLLHMLPHAEGAVHLIAELTLILVLFTDATRIDIKILRKEHDIPVRMLGIGLPLCMAFGAIAALLLFDQLNLWEAIVLGIVLAPTDAALGQAVVSSEKVPVRIRQALNVESGLNDGLALPVLLFFACLATVGHAESDENWLLLAIQQITLGPLAGIVVGLIGANSVAWAMERKWITHAFRDISILSLALIAFSSAELIGGNGFLAAFTAGMTLGNSARHLCESLFEFAEAEGQLLTLLTFLFFGGLMLIPALDAITWEIALYAVLSLTALRMLPVVISLIGLKLRWSTKWFLGWFGPRGVASILYALLLVEEGVSNKEFIFNVTMVTVALSVLLHGLTAVPWSAWYSNVLGNAKAAESEAMAEVKEVSEMPTRLPRGDQST